MNSLEVAVAYVMGPKCLLLERLNLRNETSIAFLLQSRRTKRFLSLVHVVVPDDGLEVLI